MLNKTIILCMYTYNYSIFTNILFSYIPNFLAAITIKKR